MDFATSAIDAAFFVYETISQSHKSKELHKEVSGQLLEDIQRLDELSKEEGIRDALPELDQMIAGLQDDLQQLADMCDKMYRKGPGFRGKIKYLVNTKINAADIEDELMRVEQKANRAYQFYSLRANSHNVVRVCQISETVEDTRDKINQLMDLSPVLNSSRARSDEEETFNALGADGRYRDEERKFGGNEDTLVQHSESESGPESESESDEEVSFEGSLADSPVRPRSAIANVTVSLRIDDETLERVHWGSRRIQQRDMTSAEAMQETYSLMSILHNRNSEVPVSKWVTRAITLSSTLYKPLGMIRESIQLSEISLSILRPLMESHSEVFRPLLAMTLMTYVKALEKNGQTQEALESYREGVGIYRQLAEEEPVVYGPHLAWVLDGMSTILAGLGQLEEAVELAEEAVGVMKEVSEGNPRSSSCTFELSRILLNQGITLAKANKHQEGSEARQAAVDAREELTERNPKVYGPRLAESLKYLHASLWKLERYQDAFKVLKREVEVRQEISSKDLDAHATEFYYSFVGLAKKFMVQERIDESDDACAEAAMLMQRNERGGPDVYESALADSYDVLSQRLSDDGLHELAVSTSQKSVEIREELAERDSKKYTIHLVKSLRKLARHMSGNEQREDALGTIQRAIEICEDLEDDDPDTYGPALASALTVMSDILCGLGRHEEACEAASEANERWSRLKEHNPETHGPDYARSESKLALRLEATGNMEDALCRAEKAVNEWESLTEEKPEKFRFELGRAYDILAFGYSKRGQNQKAVPPIEKSLDIFRDLAEGDRRRFKLDLASSLNTYSRVISRLGRHKEARDAIKEAVDIYRELAAERPRIYKPKLASNLYTYCERLDRTSQKREASKAAREAIEIYKVLEKEKPKAYRRRLAESRQLLSKVTRRASMASKPAARKDGEPS